MQTNSLIPEGTYGVVQRDVFHSSLDEVAEQIRRLGYAVIDSGYTEAEHQALSEAFDMARAAYVQRWGEARLKRLGELHTLRALLTHGGPLFLKLATHRVLLELLERLIEGKFALSQQNGVINPAGESYNQGAWHRDLPYQHFLSSTPLAVNALFCMDDFTTENGSTFVLPGSHRSAAFPSEAYLRQHALQVEAKAGQFIVMDCMLFHSGGRNRGNADRRAVNHAYMIPYFRQQIELPGNLDASTLSESEKSLLGFSYSSPPSVEAYLVSREKKNV